MGKSKRLKRGFWWRDGVIHARDPLTGKRTSTGCHDPTAAELWRAERERLAANPAHAAAQSARVGEWVMRTIKSKEGQRSEGTLHMYGVKLGHVVRLFGKDSPLACIGPASVDDYVSTRRSEGVTNNTIARELTCLRQVLRLAKRAGVYALDLDQVMPIGFSAEYKPRTRHLALADVPKLMAALRSDEERAWVAFALAFAADVGDVERATPGDWDPVRRLMLVHGTKTNTRTAWLPVLPHVRELAEFAISRLPISWTRASHGVGEACKRAGLEHLSPKDLRRSAATWLIEAGAEQAFVSRFLRHGSDVMVRKVYGQMRPEKLGLLLGAQAAEIPALDAIVVEGEEVPEETATYTNASQDDGPLGGIGRRRGFKRHYGASGKRGESEDSPESSVATCPETSPVEGLVGTNASQHSPAAWGLAEVAHRMGVLP